MSIFNRIKIVFLIKIMYILLYREDTLNFIEYTQVLFRLRHIYRVLAPAEVYARASAKKGFYHSCKKFGRLCF